MSTTQRVLSAAIVAVWMVGLFLAPPKAHSAPEPSVLSAAWEFSFEFGQPRLITLETANEQEPVTYWYLPYTVTNDTGEDRLFIPEFTILGDDGSLITAGKGVGPAVFNAIKQEQRNPLLESPLAVVGRLLQGDDNARDSVAIWPLPDRDINELSVFVSGLSGETAVTTNPLTDEPVLLRKTLAITFKTPGDKANNLAKPVKFTGKTWVMR